MKDLSFENIDGKMYVWYNGTKREVIDGNFLTADERGKFLRDLRIEERKDINIYHNKLFKSI